MKNNRYISIGSTFLLSLSLLIFMGCDRDFSDDVSFAEFPANGDVFINTFSAGLDFFPFVGDGADPFSFSVIMGEDVFEGSQAIRFDVPTFGNGFVGATFNTTAKRNLSGFDALTFYAKASQAATIGTLGFGIDGDRANQFIVTLDNLGVSTRYEKYVIPIPEATPLIDVVGLFFLSEGAAFEGDEGGYALFFDEIKFERLGTLIQPSPAIFGGEDRTTTNFIGSSILVEDLTQTFTLEDGTTATVNAAPSYYDFVSSNLEVARVSELGEITVVGGGTAEITALLGGVMAAGSLTISTQGGINPAPTPTALPENVRSIFSDAFVNDTESNFTPGFGGSTTVTTVSNDIDGGEVLSYTDNNFTGILFENTVDASSLNFMHVDVFVEDASVNFGIEIRDVGANQMIETNVNNGFPTGDDVDLRFQVSGLTAGEFNSIDIPLDGDLLTQRNNLGAIILVGGPDFILDNIYFFEE